MHRPAEGTLEKNGYLPMRDDQNVIANVPVAVLKYAA